MENVFTLGEKVIALNKVSQPKTLKAAILPNLEQGKEYVIDYRRFVNGQWWYGVEGIKEAVYTQDEFKPVE